MEVKGVQALIRKLKEFGDIGNRRVEAITAIAAQEIATDAARRAPVSASVSGENSSTGGSLRQSISSNKIDKLTWGIKVNVSYGAYVEFGTGTLVEVAEEWKDLAWEYYINGRGYMSPQPYLYPAYVAGRERYIQDLKDSIEDLTERFNRK